MPQPDPRPTIGDAPPMVITHGRVLGIAVPMTLAYLSTPILGLVDTTVIGRLGEPALLGAVAVGAVIFDIVFASFNFLRTGTTGLTAQALGARNVQEINATYFRALLLAFAAGIFLILLQTPVLEAGILAIGVSTSVEVAVREYFTIRILSTPFALVNYACLGWFVGLGRAGTGLFLQLILNGLNIVLNITFVLGLGWGVAGVAWGTVIAETTTALIGVALVMYRIGWFNIPPVAVIRDKVKFSALIALNGDIMLRSFVLVAAFAFFTAQSARQGDVALAANAVLMNFFMIGGHFLDGIATAAEQMAGESLGARQKAAFKRTVRLTLFWGSGLAITAFLFFWFVGPFAINMMTTSEDVRVFARTHLIWATLTPLAGFVAFQFDGVFIGATWSSDLRNMMLLSLVVFLIAWWLLMPLYGNHGLWIALLIFVGVRGITLSLRYPVRLRRSFPETV